MKYKFFPFFLFILSSFSSFQFLGNKHAIEEIKSDSTVSVTITAVGDLMCHSDEYKYAHFESDSFNFVPFFSEVQHHFNKSDFLLGNLETVTAGKERGYSGYPFFNSPDDFVESLSKIGFDLLWTSNNHSLDQGEKGILRTLDVIRNNNINYVGTFISEKDRDSIRQYDIKGLKLVVLAYSYGTNGNPIPAGKNYLINLIDTSLLKKDINSAKEYKPDLILVYFHFGEEYQRKPNEYQEYIANFTFSCGADIIIGSHPHVLQGYNFFISNKSNLDSGFVAYSLGNFISNQQWRYSDAGVILNLFIEKRLISNEIKIRSQFIPTWVFKGEIDGKKQYRILESENSRDESIYTFLNNQQRKKMKEADVDSRLILRLD